MTIKIDLKESSQAIVIDDVLNTYTKGGFYCIYRSNETVVKYPIENIWRIVEDYGKSATR